MAVLVGCFVPHSTVHLHL